MMVKFSRPKAVWPTGSGFLTILQQSWLYLTRLTFTQMLSFSLENSYQ